MAKACLLFVYPYISGLGHPNGLAVCSSVRCILVETRSYKICERGVSYMTEKVYTS